MAYITKQQQAVLRCLERRREGSLTAADLAEDLRQMDCPVGLATIYRHLERLEQSGQVHRVNTTEGALYHFCAHAGSRQSCFLLKCENCGRILHLDCAHLQDLYDHLEKDHHFRINPRGTLFTGLCESCAKKEASDHGAS